MAGHQGGLGRDKGRRAAGRHRLLRGDLPRPWIVMAPIRIWDWIPIVTAAEAVLNLQQFCQSRV